MDSKSKLQSKNPNKIQTTKIQDSKIQLESNPKDLAKLESNSPKLKDSKTFKDSMKLESSPKLDSKTSQKSNSKSKSPKIQKVKSACDSKQSKKPTKSKNSSKLKSFIRTIPISIALASALSSQAVADWTGKGIAGCTNGDGQCITGNVTMSVFDEIRSSGSATNLTISSGVTIDKTTSEAAGAGKNSLIYIGEQAGTITNHGTIILDYSKVVSRTLLIGNTLEALNNTGYITGSNIVVTFENSGKLGTLTNSGTIESSNANRGTFEIANSNQIGGITLTGNGAINHNNDRDVFRLSGQSQIGNITLNDNSSIRGNFNLSNSATIGTITIGGNSTGGSGNNASLTGNISLNNSSRISKILIDGSNSSGTNGTPKLDGNITLTTSQGITNGITIANGGTLDGNINAQSSSSIGGIAINNGSLIGSISLTNTSNITGGINVQNGGTITNNISAVGGARIDSINITNGRVGGNISANWGTAGNGIGTINQITITDGEVGGNIALANSNTMTNGMTLNNGTINGAINLNIGTADDSVASIPTISLQNASTIANITLGNSATATNDQGTVVSGRGYIDSLTLGGTSHIGNIANDRGIISTLTLEGTSSIGTITNNSNGTITNIALNGTSTITNGITNASGGTISNITLASSNTINNGITNNSGGNIGTITSNTGTNVSNTITNGGTIAKLDIQNGNTNGGNGGTIVYRSDNGIITDVLSVASGATLDIKDSTGNKGTIELRSNGATLQDGSELNLDAGSTLVGHLKNSANLAIWTNESNIQGHFINTGTIGELKAGNIQNNFLNEGSITNLTINKNIGTLTNNGSGVINTLVVQNGSNIANGIINDTSSTITTLTINDGANVTNGITNNSNIGSLDLQNNTTYSGTGSITNALDIAGTKTLTATNNGINILFNDDATGTINNAGIISGSLNNQNGSTIKTFNTGSISGSIANNTNATIETLNVDSNVGSIANSGEINTLTIQNGSNIANGITNTGDITTLIASGNVTNGITNDLNIDTLTINANANLGSGITNNSNIANLNVNSNVTYAGNGSITNALNVTGNTTQFTISNNNSGVTNTLTLTNTAGANSVKTITNDGTIIGNLINDLTSTNWTFGVLQGNFTNNGELIALTDTGSITGILTNGNNGIINTLNTSKVGGSIANNGNLVNLIVDSNKTLTGNGSITNSLVVQDNGGKGYTLTIGNNGAGNLNFKATNGTINNAGTIAGNITNVDGSLIGNFTNSGSFNGDLTNNGNITNFENQLGGNFTGNITNTAGDTISNFNNLGNITGNITNEGIITDFNNAGNIDGILTNASDANIGDFTNTGSIKEFNNQGLIAFYENSGTIGSFNNTGTIYGVLNSKVINGNFENVANALKNTGTISGNVELVGQRGTCNSSTICQLSGLWNEGTIGGTFTNEANKTIDSVINGSNSQTNINAVLNGGIANSGIIGEIHNYSNGTINNGITNNANANIESITNQGTINGGITNSSQIGMIDNTGLITGNLTNNTTSSIITTINTGSITGSITNSGDIDTLNVTGNVNNGITHTAGNIANLTINKGVILGNSGITNNAAIGNFTNNANITYRGSGSITGNFINAKDSTITLNNDLILNGKDNAFRNDGTLKGTISNIGALSSFTNTGSITGLESGNITGTLSNSNTGIIDNLVVDGKVSQMQNAGNIADAIIKSEIANGIINGDSNYKQATIGKLDIQASLGSNGLQNAGTITSLINNFSNTKLNNDGNIGSLDIQKNLNYSGNGSITDSIDIASNTTLTTNGITLNATNGSVNNEGILAGALTLEGSSNSVTNSGSITAIINNANNSNLTNNSNIGTLKVYESVNYKGNGSDRITQALEVAKDKTLTIGNSGTLSFESTNGTINNAGIIEGNLSNVKDSIITNFKNSGTISGNITNKTDSTITNFKNSGTISGDLYNDGHIDTLSNTGTMGTIYNRSKNTIENLLNDKNSVIAGIDNSNGRYDLIQNQGTILGDIKNDNGTITNLFNTNNGTITGQIISNGDSNIGTIINEGVINSSHTMNSGSIQDASNDAISLDTISNVVTAISNSGSINGNVRVAGNSKVDLIQNSSTIAGCIILEGGRIGNINNTNGAIANCMSFSGGASVGGLNNDGTISGTITNDSGSITVNNGGSGSIGGITTSGGGNTTIINGGMDKPGGDIGLITNNDNSNTHIDGWTLDNPENPDNAIKVTGNLDGIHLKEDSIFVNADLETGKTYNYHSYIKDAGGTPIGEQFSQDDELFNALTFIDIFNPTDNGDGTFSVGLDTRELSGKTLGASLIYSSRMRQINTNSMLREINVKNFKTDFEILEQRERLKNQQALLENYKQQRESYLNGLTKDNKELKRVSSKESTSLSTYANNSNIKSDAIEVVDYYNKDTLASLDNLQATTKANQETYSNLDLLRELDDIFISHTGDKDNLYTFALPYTGYTSAQLDGGVGTLKSHASGILAGAQAKLPSERGILGIYFGYESSDKQVGQQRLDFDEKVYYGGLTYYNVFARKGVSEYYLSANTRIDKGDTNLYKTYRTGSTTIDSQVDSYGYGADLKVGANYYNIYNNSVLSPEIGISYQGISTDSFRLRHLGGVSEHYYAQDVNFFDISASLRWQRAWNNVFKTMASLGAMYNVYNDAKGSGVIAGLKQSADINVEELYGTTQVGISYALGENANIALNYSGIFANGVQSHAGYIRLGVWW